MGRFVVVDAAGMAVNVVVLNEGAAWSPPKGHRLHPIGNAPAEVGWKWDGQKLVDPNPPKAPVKPTRGMSIA